MTANPGWRAAAVLYHRFFTGLLLTVVTRRSAADAGELTFRLFRRQHHEKFLSSLGKLGLDETPDVHRRVLAVLTLLRA